MIYALEKKSALVTGASRGFGALLCEELAYRGVEVTGVARTESDLKNLQQSISYRNGKFSYIPADLSEPRERKRIIEAIYKNGGINLLVNNVGEFRLGYPEEIEIDEIERMAQLDFIAGVQLYEMWKRQYKEKHETAKKPEAVLWISSVSGIFGWPGDPFYQAWKTAISAYVQGEIFVLQKQKEQAQYDQRIREYYGPQLDLNIRHIVLYPDTTETESLKKVIGRTLNDRWKNWYVIRKESIRDSIIAVAVKALGGEGAYGNYNHIAILGPSLDTPDGIYSFGMPLNPETGRPDYTKKEKIECLGGPEDLVRLTELIKDTGSIE
jgi:NADP-dependent 3-hydroxy acid dehydrogenase YdfG